MLAAMPTESVVGLVLLLVAAGLLGGFLSGVLGIGGGGILVPVLYEVFGALGVPEDIRMHVTLGTTLGVIAPTVLTSFSAFRARGSVDMDIVWRMGPWVFFGVLLGVVIADHADSVALRWIWVVFGSALAIKMVLGRDDWRIADTLPPRPWLETGGFFIGAASTLMGIGGATFTVPLLTLYGRPLLRAVATATGIGPIIALPGLVGYMIAGWGEPGLPPYSLGYVNAGALLVAPLGVLAAPLGVRVAHGIPKRTLELAFAAFLICVVSRFLWTLLA
ncbi:sulfite exporter TauE/SafE family protein [Hyphomicrobium methylovorum]|nr:sulfite exporter TauE/SafE family protein [Hyphomicrobium methylovorum]MBA2124883.1 sulfite exporter TauE/SafE family protein [Hyphomicrobium methylovorum]